MSPRRDRRSLLADALQRTEGDPHGLIVTPGPTLAEVTAERDELARQVEDAHLQLRAVEQDHQDTVRMLQALRDEHAGCAQRYLAQAADSVPMARNSDPSTSKTQQGVRTPSQRNQLGRLLLAFDLIDSTTGLQGVTQEAATSERAALVAGLSLQSEYAKRASDLQALGYLRPRLDDDGREVTALGSTGRPRLVFAITDDGRRLARAIRAEMKGEQRVERQAEAIIQRRQPGVVLQQDVQRD